jgi:S-DNA-T family DNA segregation ATPase FtsK/SpoIIIE
MLLSTGSDLIRLQCAFIDTPEVEEVTDFIGMQRAYPQAWLLPEYFDEEVDTKNDFDPNERDELFEDAARIIVQTQQGSTSMLQRRLKLGYNRAGRIIDQLEAAGIVGPFEGSKAREVKVANEMALDQLLKDMEMLDNEKL